MELLNETGFPGLAFKQYTPQGLLNVAVALRGTFDIVPGQALEVSGEQYPFNLTDEYQSPTVANATGAEPDAHLINPGDLIPYRPGTDVIVLSHAYNPNPRKPFWDVGVKVDDREKVLRVHGPRSWRALRNGREEVTGFEMGEAEAAGMAFMNYASAFGGPIPGSEDVYLHNPLGPGIANLTLEGDVPAPRLEDPADPVIDWRKEYPPQGFFPIPPFWKQRQQFAGTYDTIWQHTHHPFLPEDFDYRFYQYAHPDLIFTPHLQGDEPIQLVRLHREHERLNFRLPGLNPICVPQRADGKFDVIEMVLDGVYLFLLDASPKAVLTWRAGFLWDDRLQAIETRLLTPDLRERLEGLDIPLLKAGGAVWGHR